MIKGVMKWGNWKLRYYSLLFVMSADVKIYINYEVCEIVLEGFLIGFN